MSNPIERLNAQDMSFLAFEDHDTPMHVASLMLFETGPLRTADGGVDVQRIAKYVEARLDMLPRYRRRLAATPGSGHPVWVDDPSFDIGFHVRHAALPKPGDEVVLKRVVGRILDQRLDRDHPLWEMWILEGLSGDRFATLLKIHHSMIDGASGMHLASILFGPERIGEAPAATAWRPEPPPSRASLLREEFKAWADQSQRVVHDLGRLIVEPIVSAAKFGDALAAIREAIGGAVSPCSDTPLNQPHGSHRRLDWLSFPLDEIKRISHQLDATVNDFLLAMIAAGLRQFLIARGVSLEGLHFRVCLPVDVRVAGDDLRRANHVSAIFVSLPLDERDPLRQLEGIKQQTRRLKSSNAARGIDLLVQLGDLVPGTWLTRMGVGLVNQLPTHNLIVTNVPGPKAPLYLLGAEMQAMIPVLPLFEKQDLGIAITSYRDALCLGINADWAAVPDLCALTEAFDGAMEELVSAAEEES